MKTNFANPGSTGIKERRLGKAVPHFDQQIRNGHLRRQRGAEMVEMAFLLPLLLTLLIGIFWAGRAYNIYETITRAAREGARVAVTPECATCTSLGSWGTCSLSADSSGFPDSTSVLCVVNASLSASSLSCSSCVTVQQHQQLNLDPNNPNAGWTVVSITYPFQFTLPFTSLNMTTINIPTTVQMLEEQ
jgi:Flp pilus assembly protein TadG